MNLYINNHNYHYEMENLARAFLFTEDVSVIREYDSLTEPYILTSATDEIKVEISIDGFRESACAPRGDDDELTMARLMYRLLSKALSRELPWGILTGVRPIKLYSHLLDTEGEDRAKEYFKNTLFVSEPKISLAGRVAANQRNIIARSGRRSFSLYVSIPFCPTRCNYCSFVSQSIEKAKKLIDSYLPLLLDEIRHTAILAEKLGLELLSV